MVRYRSVRYDGAAQMEPKKVLITGGSSGIGRAIAEELAKYKHQLLLVARDAGRLKRTAEELRTKYGVNVQTVLADVGNEAEVARVRRYCEKQFLPNVLVLNAGVWMEGSVATAKPKDIEALMKVNVYQVFHFAREFVPLLENQPVPRIILTAPPRVSRPINRRRADSTACPSGPSAVRQ